MNALFSVESIKSLVLYWGLLDESVPKTECPQKLKKVSRRQSDPKKGAVRSSSSDR